MKDTNLHRAIRDKDLEQVRSLIHKSAHLIEREDKTMKSILHVAVEFGSDEILKLLLNSGAKESLNFTFNGVTPIFLAIKLCKREALRILLEAKNEKFENVTQIYNCDTVLHQWAEHGDPEMLKILLEYGAETFVGVKSRNGKTALALLVELYLSNKRPRKPLLESIKIMFNNGASTADHIPGYSLYSCNILLIAVGRDDEKLIELLLDAKANLGVKTPDGNTPLALAVRQGKKSRIIQLLVEAGSDVNFKTPSGTLLQIAAEKYDIELVKYLMYNGANFTGMDMSASTVVLQLIYDQMITLKEKIEREVENQAQSRASLDKIIEKLEICHRGIGQTIGKLEGKMEHLEQNYEQLVTVVKDKLDHEMMNRVQDFKSLEGIIERMENCCGSIDQRICILESKHEEDKIKTKRATLNKLQGKIEKMMYRIEAGGIQEGDLDNSADKLCLEH